MCSDGREGERVDGWTKVNEPHVAGEQTGWFARGSVDTECQRADSEGCEIYCCSDCLLCGSDAIGVRLCGNDGIGVRLCGSDGIVDRLCGSDDIGD